MFFKKLFNRLFRKRGKAPKQPQKKRGFGLGSRIKALFVSGKVDATFFESLEEVLIESDMGSRTTGEVIDELKAACQKREINSYDELKEIIKEIIKESLIEAVPEPVEGRLNLYLILGVNGVGKTTAIARMGNWYKEKSRTKVALAAGDTFRAAAIDQLKIQGERIGARVIAQERGADPGAVIFDAIESALAKGEDLLLGDTAGRLHNKKNLIAELQKIDRIILQKEDKLGSYRKILVLDATTGQNGVRQAEAFCEAIGVDGIVLTKYDSTGRGGFIVSIARQMKIPIYFVGIGERLTDLIPFNRDSFVDELLKE